MANRKSKYKDLERWRNTVKSQKRRYYQKTQGLENSWARWSGEEDRLVLEHNIPDSELALVIQRSVSSIQMRRHKLSHERGGRQ